MTRSYVKQPNLWMVGIVDNGHVVVDRVEVQGHVTYKAASEMIWPAIYVTNFGQSRE